MVIDERPFVEVQLGQLKGPIKKGQVRSLDLLSWFIPNL